MFDNMKITSFYNKLKKGKFINKDYFDTISDDLKTRIVSDNRFAQNIDVSLIMKENLSNKEHTYVIDKIFLENLNDDNLKIIISKLLSNYNVTNTDLTNLFPVLKNRLLETKDNELKEKISDLLFASVKESFQPKIDYINTFISLFLPQERIELLEIESMRKFLTFHSKNIDIYYGYDNFLKNIIDRSYDDNLKCELTNKILEFMPKTVSIKSLYINLIKEQLNDKDIINILNNDEISKLYNDYNTFKFTSDVLLDVINKIDSKDIKKELIQKYFSGYENYIENIISSKNKENDKNNVNGNTILAFYELGFIKGNIEDIIIKNCKDEVLFDFISKHNNKEELLLKISSDIDIKLLIEFSNKNNINIYQKQYAQKFCFNDLYFKSLPLEYSDLIQFYSGSNSSIYYEKLGKCENKDIILNNSLFKFELLELTEFCKKYNLNIYNEKFAHKFSDNDMYFNSLTNQNCNLIQFYRGKNSSIYYGKLEKCMDKNSVLFNSSFEFELPELLEFSKKHNIDIYFPRFANTFNSDDLYFENIPNEKSYLINKYTGTNIDLFINKISKCDNKLELIFFNNINVDNDNICKVVIDRGILNDKEKQSVSELLNLNDDKLKTIYKNYLLKNYDNIPTEKINVISDLLFRISITNSEEILNFREQIANQVLETDNPIDNFKNIEELFIKNNLPIIGKLYSVFDILHPEFKDFDFDNDKISPMLKNKSTRGRKVTVFSDLLKASLGSNNRSIKEYLYNLENGEKIYKSIINNEVTLDKLNNNDLQILKSFINNLITLYNTSNKNNNLIHLTNDLEQNITLISEVFKDSNNLSDRIVRMFGYFSGFNNIEEIKRYIEIKNLKTTTKNYKTANEPFKLEVGDYIKGIGSIDYLSNILQNGSLAKEFLGAYSSSDLTPLDTDLSKVLDVKNNLHETINSTTSSGYGPILFVLKNDDRFFLSRNSDSVENIDNVDNKLEVFYTGVAGKDHYGIRTGFASSEINYIISKDNDPRIGLEIALNGFYIPVVDINGNLIFTPNDYEKLRKKMSGLKHYGLNDYKFSNNLNSPGIDEILNTIKNDVSSEKDIINKHIEKVISKLDLKLKTNSDGDLTPGSVEFIDTGSTGRKTNLPGKSDFDFMMRLDNSLLYDKEKLENFKNDIIKSFVSIENKFITSTGDFRLQGVQIEGLDETIDLDISFTQKTNKVSYSTDTSLKDRLDTIKKQDSTKYKLVIGNILLAKKFLKESGVYKPKHSRLNPEGGLGGVGIENWILQNGGSFIDACNDFINVSKNKSFDEFRKTYQIWDFGENYLSGNNNRYSHDNFVNNISEEGYNKLKEVLTSYVNDNVVNTNCNKKTN